MDKLRVEELEPRLLFSCSSGFLLPPPPATFVAGSFMIGVIEPVSFMFYGGHVDLIAPGTCFEDEPEIGPGEHFSSPGLGGKGPASPPLFAPIPPGSLAAWTEKWGSGAGGARPDHAESGLNAIGDLGNAGTHVWVIHLTPPESTNNSRGAHGVSAEAAPQIPLDSPFPERAPPLDENPVDIPGRVDEKGATPFPQVFDLLTVLPRVDLSTLERGMQQFLAQVDDLGQQLGDSSGPGLYPWIASAAAAAVACEIARRQLKQPAGVLIAEANSPTGFPPDEPFVG
jgi:hypothetical protein